MTKIKMNIIFYVIFFCLAAESFAKSGENKVIRAQGPVCPIDDPLYREAFPINYTLDPILRIDVGSYIDNLIISGLSTYIYEVNYNLITLTVSFELKLESLSGAADNIIASGYINASPFRQETIPSGNFVENGRGEVSITGFNLKGRAKLYINSENKTQISSLNLETLRFESLAVNLDGFTVGGVLVDWNEWNAIIKANFDRDFSELGTPITEKIRDAANTVVGKYTLSELVEATGGAGGDDDCK